MRVSVSASCGGDTSYQVSLFLLWESTVTEALKNKRINRKQCINRLRYYNRKLSAGVPVWSTKDDVLVDAHLLSAMQDELNVIKATIYMLTEHKKKV